MRVLGIDPGTATMGYALLEADGEPPLAYGALSERRQLPLAQRLAHLHARLAGLMEELRPGEVALEEPFVSQDKNRRTGIAVGQAQALALLVAASRDLPIATYSPAQVKQAVAGHGAGSKDRVQKMVRLQLGLSELPRPEDAADAVAVALCHLRVREAAGVLASGGTA